MKNILKIASLLAAAVMLFACEKAAPVGDLQLNIDKVRILADGKDSVKFVVLWENTDVTASAVIDAENVLTGQKFSVEGAGFSTTEESIYRFSVTYNEDYVAKLVVAKKVIVDANADIAASFKMSADKDVIQANGQDAAVLKVLLEGFDITSAADIYTEDDELLNLKDGKLLIPQNTWYIGTANNDDSTFSVSDKVYDRAVTINIDTKGQFFEAPDTPPSRISYSSVSALYQKALEEYPVEQKYLDMIEELDNYVIKKFRVAFGNRIMKQLQIFVPVYVACGGEVVEGIDHMLATKVFRKFETLNLALIRDEIKGLINYLNTLFGKDKMKSSIEFLDRLQRSY